MRLLLLALAACMILSAGGAAGQLTSVPGYKVYLEEGKSCMLDVHVTNPDYAYAKISVSLSGSYTSARFSDEAGASVAPDGRSLFVFLNPGEEMSFSLVLLSSQASSLARNIRIDSSTDASGKTDVENIVVLVKPVAAFPGLDAASIALMSMASVAAYWLARSRAARAGRMR